MLSDDRHQISDLGDEADSPDRDRSILSCLQYPGPDAKQIYQGLSPSFVPTCPEELVISGEEDMCLCEPCAAGYT